MVQGADELYSSLPPANHIFLNFNHFSFYFILFSMSRDHMITCRAYRTLTEPTEIIPMTNHTISDTSRHFQGLFGTISLHHSQPALPHSHRDHLPLPNTYRAYRDHTDDKSHLSDHHLIINTPSPIILKAC